MKRLLSVLLLGLGLSATAHAVPWCHRGHISTVADITLNEAQLISYAANHLPSPLPIWVTDPDRYIAFHASEAACGAYVGWSGPNFGVPGAGQVTTVPYAPTSYVSQITGYSISQGVSFKCNKCMPFRVLRMEVTL